MDYQGISFPLADSATDVDARAAARPALSPGMVDAGADPKLIHAKASMAKLFVSEAAGRCADRAVQAFGGIDGATCARTWPSGSTASCASIASGRGRARCSG